MNLPQQLDADERYADWKPKVMNDSGREYSAALTFTVAKLEADRPPTTLEVDDAEDMGDCVNPEDAEAADIADEEPPVEPECAHRKETLERQGCEVSDEDMAERGFVVSCRTTLARGENEFLLTLVGPDVLMPDDADTVEGYPDVTAGVEIAVAPGTVSDEGTFPVTYP